MKLVASMIVHNEMDRYLPLALEHLATYCDEVRVLDDGSTDGTLEYLAGLREKVIVRPNPGPKFFEHEGRARQALLDWTLDAQPDYVLSIDADEFVGDPEIVHRSMLAGGHVYTLQMEEIWRCNEVTTHIRVDHQWAPRRCPILWKAPQRAGGEWRIPDIQLACGREPLMVRRTRAAVSGTSVLHLGWANQQARQTRAERYYEHDRGRFHKNAHLESILWPDERVLTQQKLWPKGLAAFKDRIAEVANR